MKPSYKPVACGLDVCLMSPLGAYPDTSLVFEDTALVIDSQACFSIIRIKKEDWGFSEVDSLSPLQIPLLGGLLLSGVGCPYPAHGLTLESASHEQLTPECVSECRTHLLNSLQEAKTGGWPSAIVHLPPAMGGNAYELARYDSPVSEIRNCESLLQVAEPVVLRGVGSLIKAHMAWRHREFADAACIYLWIALDAAHSLTLQNLRASGITNPTSKDASEYFNKIVGYETPWDKFFEQDYENRIRAIHPDNRFGAEARPQFLADDFYELSDLLIPYFRFLVTGTFPDHVSAA